MTRIGWKAEPSQRIEKTRNWTPSEGSNGSQSDEAACVKAPAAQLDGPPMPDPKKTVAPARACAYAVVRRVFEQGAWADRALHGEARRHRLDTRDLALATQLTFGTVQRVATLDHVI